MDARFKILGNYTSNCGILIRGPYKLAEKAAVKTVFKDIKKKSIVDRKCKAFDGPPPIFGPFPIILTDLGKYRSDNFS